MDISTNRFVSRILPPLRLNVQWPARRRKFKWPLEVWVGHAVDLFVQGEQCHIPPSSGKRKIIDSKAPLDLWVGNMLVARKVYINNFKSLDDYPPGN